MYSIIVPVAREGPGLYDRIKRLDRELRRIYGEYPRLSGFSHEILVVTDVPDPATVKAASRLAREGVARGLLLSRRIGKGGSIKNAVPHARGDYIVLLDADMPVHPLIVAHAVYKAREEGADMVIANRLYKTHGAARQLLSVAYNAFVNLLFRTGVWDHQAGFKVLSRRAAEAILLGRSRIDGLAYDTEMIVWARRLGLRYMTYDVVWIEERMGSTIPKARAVLTMFADLLALRILTLPGQDLGLERRVIGDVIDLATLDRVGDEFMTVIRARGWKRIILDALRRMYIAVGS